MQKNSMHGYATLGLLALLIVGSGVFYFSSPVVNAKKQTPTPVSAEEKEEYPYSGEHVAVFLDDMRLELRGGTTTLGTAEIISIGRPGSYYETIGGAYENDYKILKHFSSLGEVYLPYAVHIFGNYFIHGIPYYPNGKQVSSEYSGGCIRLSDEDAKRVYDFVSRGTPIVIVKKDIKEWTPAASITGTLSSMDMTRYMATIVSLDVLNQDNEIRGINGEETTRRKLIPQLLQQKDDAVIGRFAYSLGNETFTDYMNKKAASLGLANTSFENVDGSATTTPEEFARFMRYIADYKPYVFEVASATPQFSR